MKTVSLEIASQLKANGYTQEGAAFYYWRRGNQEYQLDYKKDLYTEDKSIIAAPTVDEIIDILPKRVKAAYGKGHLQIEKNGKKNYCIMYTFVKSLNSTKSLAEAAGRMWLYLKEKNLLHA